MKVQGERYKKDGNLFSWRNSNVGGNLAVKKWGNPEVVGVLLGITFNYVLTEKDPTFKLSTLAINLRKVH